MWLPTKAQVDAASRHAITAAGVAVTIFGLQAKGVSMDNIKALIEGLGNTANSIIQLIAAAGVFYGAIKAASTASPVNQIATVQAIANSPQAVSQDAKVALLDATASLPEVVGEINVTDPKLVQDTSSNQIVKTKGMAT